MGSIAGRGMARPVGNLPAVTPEVLKLVDEEMKKKQSTASPVGELSLAVQEKEDEEFWVVKPERVSSWNQFLRVIVFIYRFIAL